jgi:iron complex outermembrane receptor protein
MLSGVGIGAMAVAMLAGPTLAQAQSNTQSQPGAVDEIVVTGVRASVGSALQLRKNASQLVDSIVAEDIGKLPDNNVVEALQHVSGVSIVRNSVEPGTVLIRGLPDIATTLNGRQIFTSSGRFISLPDLPAELLAKVDVKKSTTASDIEGGIAGLIDVSLHRPFDFKEPQIAGGFKASYGSLSKKYSPQASVLLSNRRDTNAGEFGLLVDGSYYKRQTSTDSINQITQQVARRTVPGVTATGPGGTFPGSAAVAVGQVTTPNTTTFGQADTLINRQALNVSAQWRPNESFEAYSEFFYSRLRNEAPNQVNVFLLGTCANNAETKPFPGTNVVQIAPSGCYGLTSVQDRHTEEDTYQAVAGGKWYVNDQLTFDGEFDYTHSKNNTTAIIVDAQYNYGSLLNGVTLNYDAPHGGVIATQPAQQQVNGANTYLDQFYDTTAPARGHEYAARLNGNYKFGDDSVIRSIDFGYRWNDRSAISDGSLGGGLDCANTAGDGSLAINKYRVAAINSPACVAYRNGATPQPFTRAGTTSVGGISYASLGADAWSVTKGSFFDGMFGTDRWATLAPGWSRDNVEKLRNLFGYSGPRDNAPTNHFEVSEEAHSFFAKANYAIDLGSIPVDGNFGLRVIRTTLTEAGFTQTYVAANPALASGVGVNGNCITCVVYTPIASTRKDTQYLPSFNLRAKLVDNLYLRAGYSKTVTRPTFTQLNPGLTVNPPTATLQGTATGGNPNLNPVKSTNYDADLSYYWGKTNNVSISTFYRQVSGYIQTGQSNITLQGQNYIQSIPVNFQNANIKGIEGSYTQFLDFLPGLWSGLGFSVNGTHIEAPFNNVAPNHVNFSGIYEKDKYSFRFSYTWNDEYLVGAFATGAQPQQTYASVRENADVSFNYRLNDKTSISLDATNILDNYQRQHAGKGSENARLYPTGLQRFEKTYAIGIRTKW